MNLLEFLINESISLIFRLWPQPRPKTELLEQIKIVAHRGVHESRIASENTLESFRLAVKNKIWGIEFDVRFTNDDVAVIHHDPAIYNPKTRESLKIESCSYSELSLIKTLPTLKDVVSKFGQKIHLMIEVKEDLTNYPNRIKIILGLLAGLRPEIDYHLLSLSPEYLECFRSFSTGIAYQNGNVFMDVIWLNPNSTFLQNAKLNHGSISGHFMFFNKRKISDLHLKNKKIGVGFVDSRNLLYREVNRGADYIFTNHPLRLNNFIK